ncbi:MAG TPA: class I SAM-dependent methyltransferase, partial [Thermoanaerobaculia bacterium]|nr:class I SAM-dependent methyltransferase [Thermoanaerobaculia bacterium]
MTTLPFPPVELRRMVGPIDDASFDNPTGQPIFPDVPPGAYDSVLDWGCGCGRLARKLIQQSPRPRHYLGIDLNRVAVQWCVESLSPHAPHFRFLHQDVYNAGLNPKGTADALPFPAEERSISLLIAWSVFTHVLESQAAFYLREIARV